MTDSSLSARGAALDILRDVLHRRIPLDQSLDAHPGLPLLPTRDRAFARLLTATVLRRLGQIDTVLSVCLNRAGPPKAAALDLLRLGAAQLLFLGTPAHAAVDTTVALAAERGSNHFKGLINAVLRRCAREGADLVAGQDAGRLNTPDWLWLAWRQAYGTAITRGIVDANLNEAPLDLTVRADPAMWADRLPGTVLANGTLRCGSGGAVTELPGFAEGAWWVQDLAAALPARLLGPIAGQTVFDLCAAPGGKTAQLAAAGALVTAVDRSAPRLERLRRNLDRLGLEAELVTADAAIWRPAGPADAVLLDAPCSATGTIRRHPDIWRIKSPDDVIKLAALQRRLLAHAIELVRPGGRLVYCVCSLQPEEAEAQIESLLATEAPVAREPITPDEIGGWSELINSQGDLRSRPGQLVDLGGIDGFYAARLRRSA